MSFRFKSQSKSVVKKTKMVLLALFVLSVLALGEGLSLLLNITDGAIETAY